MERKNFSIPNNLNHIFAIRDEKGEITYYQDEFLKDLVMPDECNTDTIVSIDIPKDLKKIEISKVLTKFNNSADTLHYFHLWPFPHMRYAEIITDGNNYEKFSLHNDNLKCAFRESLEKSNWESSILIVYEKSTDNSKIGFLLFR